MKNTGLMVILATLVFFAGAAYAQQSSSGTSEGMQGSSEMQHKKMSSSQTLKPETVKKIQEALNNKGYHAGPVDGKWGQMSKKALMDFQKAEGIKATGKADTQTLAKLGISEGAGAGGMKSEESKGGENSSSGKGGETGGK